MTSFLATRPILACVLLMIPLPGIWYLSVTLWCELVPLGPGWGAALGIIDRIEYCLALTHLLWPLICSAPIALLRRRSGATMKPLLLVLVLAPAVIGASWVVFNLCIVIVNGESIAESLGRLFHDMWVYRVSIFVLPVAGAAFGPAIGWTVAALLIHSGRWETIVAVPKPREV